ncbi:MAG: hypothetical protein JWM95_4208, partial [Gemmatimonadetes bacterium]|nr:hypothetical protein [Gemmatimonadota bacterium]
MTTPRMASGTSLYRILILSN